MSWGSSGWGSVGWGGEPQKPGGGWHYAFTVTWHNAITQRQNRKTDTDHQARYAHANAEDHQADK